MGEGYSIKQYTDGLSVDPSATESRPEATQKESSGCISDELQHMVSVANGPGPAGRQRLAAQGLLALSSRPPRVQEETRGEEPEARSPRRGARGEEPGSLAVHPERRVDWIGPVY